MFNFLNNLTCVLIILLFNFLSKVREYFSWLMCKPCYNQFQFYLYREILVRAISTFIEGVNTEDAQLLIALENPVLSPIFDHLIFISSLSDTTNYNVTSTGPFCSHSLKKLVKKPRKVALASKIYIIYVI